MSNDFSPYKSLRDPLLTQSWPWQQHKKWQQEGMGRSPPYENARMLQAMQNREDQQRWEEMQRMQRFSPSRRAAEMEMAMERRLSMGSMMPMPQMEMEMKMEMMRRRQQ